MHHFKKELRQLQDRVETVEPSLLLPVLKIKTMLLTSRTLKKSSRQACF